MDMEKQTEIYVPEDLYDMHSHDLHILAETSEEDRRIINAMDRERYIRRWYISGLNNSYYTPTVDEVEYALNNYWYYVLYFGRDTFSELMRHIGNIDNKKLYIYIHNIPLYTSRDYKEVEPHQNCDVAFMNYDVSKFFNFLKVRASILDLMIDISIDYARAMSWHTHDVYEKAYNDNNVDLDFSVDENKPLKYYQPSYEYVDVSSIENIHTLPGVTSIEIINDLQAIDMKLFNADPIYEMDTDNMLPS